ncbi:Lipase A, partial [Lachnellula suecica]
MFTAYLQRRQTPIPPDSDPFYTAPSRLADIQPGDILGHRPAPYPIMSLNTTIPNIAAAYQILFRTTDGNVNAEAAVTTLLVPKKADPWKLLSYQMAEDAAYSDCAPSIVLQKSSTGNIRDVETVFIEAALKKGWCVVVPDFEGSKSAYVAGPQAGYTVLDSLRAVLKSHAFSDIVEEPRIALWGYSGGAFATNWALELQEGYAPELRFVGAATGGTINNIGNAIENINKRPYAGLVAAGLMGLGAAYPDFAEFLEGEFVPETEAKFKSVLTQCSSVTQTEFAGQDILAYFKDGAALLNASVVKSTFEKVNLGKHVPITPLYVYKAVHDEISPIADTDVLLEYYCAGNASVEYKRDLVAGHVTLAITGAGEALAWLDDRMAGKPARVGCSNSTGVSTVLDPVG